MPISKSEVQFHIERVVRGVADRKCELDTAASALGNLKFIEDQLSNLVEQLESTESNSQWNDLDGWLEDEYGPILHSINHIRSFLQDAQPSKQDQRSAQVFAKFLDSEVPQFVQNYSPTTR